MKKTNNRVKIRFTNIELLCLILIIGLILFMAFGHFLSFFKISVTDEKVSLELTMTKAAEEYFQNHLFLLPKDIGKSNFVSLEELLNKNYLKEPIYDTDSNSCMDYSYVKVFHTAEQDYSYIAYLYCGDEEPPAVEIVPSPVVSLSFSGGDGEQIDANDFELVKKASFVIDISGGQTRGGTSIPIDYYSFFIKVITKSGNNKDYDSGVLYTNRYDHLKFMKKISDYVDLDDALSISVCIKVQNIVGGIQEVYLSSS